jgi:hypothetical protein
MQVTPRRDSCKQAAVANRLNAVRSIAQHVLATTIYDERISDSVKRCKAGEPFLKGQVFVGKDQHFYLVTSKFEHRFYVVVFNKRIQQYQCSATDEAIKARCISQVREYIHLRRAAWFMDYENFDPRKEA